MSMTFYSTLNGTVSGTQLTPTGSDNYITCEISDLNDGIFLVGEALDVRFDQGLPTENLTTGTFAGFSGNGIIVTGVPVLGALLFNVLHLDATSGVQSFTAASLDTSQPNFSSSTTASFAEGGTGTAYTAVALASSGMITGYALGGTDAALFDINGSTGAVTFKTVPDFEAPGDSGGNNVYDITITATQTGGATSDVSVAITVTDVDEVVPLPPTGLDLAAASDSGASDSDDITSDTTPTISGSAQAGSTVTLYDSDGTTALGSTTANGSGAWSITTSVLAEGTHSLTAKATDAAGDSSASAALLVTIDTTAPTLSASTPAAGATGFAVGSDIVLAFDGAMAAGSGNVTLYRSGGTVVETFAAGSLAIAGNKVTVNPSVNLAYGTGYYVLVDAGAVKDVAGNAYAGIASATSQAFSTETPSDGGGGNTITVSGTISHDATVFLSGDAFGGVSAALPAGTTISSHGTAIPVGTDMASFFMTSDLNQTFVDTATQAAASAALSQFLTTLAAGTAVTTTSVSLGSADGLPKTIRLTGNGNGNGTELMIIDASALPAGSVIDLNGIEFAVVIGRVTVTGGAGSNTVVGDYRAQYVMLGEADDTLAGGLGNDTIGSAAGADNVAGGDGQDSVFGGDDGDLVFGNQGNDLVFGNQGNDFAFGGKDDDWVFGGGGADSVYGDSGDDRCVGDDGNDHVFGNQGADTVCGNAGSDIIFGGADNDRLFGGADADRVFGDDGSDTLAGGAAADTLAGGEGADAFCFALPGDGGDLICDFTAGEDVLALLSSGFGLASGPLDASLFAESGQETTDTRFVFLAASSVLLYDPDGVGSRPGTALATLAGVSTLSASDIMVLAG